MRITKTGTVLCSLYLITSIGCVVWALVSNDPKGSYILLQMPIVLQHGLLLALDATHLLKNMNWTGLYLLLGVPMLGFLIAMGNIIEFTASRIRYGASALSANFQPRPK